MPFELGLAVALHLRGVRHKWFVFEARPHRLLKSLSDLNSIDALVHGRSAIGVFRELTDAFGTQGPNVQPSMMQAIYRPLQDVADQLKSQFNTDSVFRRAIFTRLVIAARDLERRRATM